MAAEVAYKQTLELEIYSGLLGSKLPGQARAGLGSSFGSNTAKEERERKAARVGAGSLPVSSFLCFKCHYEDWATLRCSHCDT